MDIRRKITVVAALTLCIASADFGIAQDGRASAVQPSASSPRQISPAISQSYTGCMMAFASGSCITATSRSTCEVEIRRFEPLCLSQLPEDSQRNLKAALEFDASGVPPSTEISPAYELLKSARQGLLVLQSGSQPMKGSSN